MKFRAVIPASQIYDTFATVYKYRSFNENSLSIIIDKQLFFATPTSLNDPHDSQIDVRIALLSAIEQAVKSKEIPPERLRAIVDAREIVLAGNPFSDLATIQSCAICSLAMRADEPLMWAHYAADHKGFCLGFNPRLIREKSGINDNVVMQAVTYTNNNPFLPALWQFVKGSYASSSGEGPSAESLLDFVFMSTLATKSLAWSYEKELRFLRMKGGAGSVSFKPEALTELVFGCRMPERHRSTLINLVRTTEFGHVRLKQVVKSSSEFSFHIEDL